MWKMTGRFAVRGGVLCVLSALMSGRIEAAETQTLGTVAELTRDGRTEWRVSVSASAGVVERFARDELRKYVEKMSGAPLPDADRADGGRTIRLGLREQLGVIDGLPAAKSGWDGYSVLVSVDSIVIAGDNPRGVLYGVYDLLERLGCRWYVPTLDPKDPEVVPREPNLRLPAGAWSESGRIEMRFYNGSALFFEIIPDRLLPQIDWAAKNRFNGVSWQAHHEPGRVGLEMKQMEACGALREMEKRGLMLHGPCHCFPFFLPTERYFKDHPEWFGMWEGKRQPHGAGAWPLMNYCWSNAEANAEFTRNVEAFLKQWPQLKVLCMVWIDGGKVCQCPECRKRGGSNLIVDLFNNLSERLEKTAPGVMLETVLGYPPIEEPPQGVGPNGKWQGVYAHWGRNHRQSYGDADYARRDNLRAWTSQFKRYEICSYYAAASHQPFHGPPFLHALEGDTEYFVKQGTTGTYVLQYPHGFWWNFSFNLGAAGMYSYYYPERSPRFQLRDYALHYFGPAAGAILAQYLERLGSNENLEISYRAGRGEASSADRQWLETMAATIKRAASLAGDDPVYAYRVSKLRAGMNVLLRMARARQQVLDAERIVSEYREGKCGLDEARKAVASGQDYVKSFLVFVNELNSTLPGVVAPEWFESWTMNRTITGPLDKLAASLAAPTSGPTTQSVKRAPRIVPIGEGWARSKVNATIFRQHAVTTSAETQYTAFYDPEGRLVLARRKLSSTHWDTRVTPYSGNVRDAHNTISLAADGRGILHVSWDHHGHPLRYVRSVSPGSIELTDKMSMTGSQEARVTYPEFFNLDSGDLLFLYRDGGSGRGDTMLNRFDPWTNTWSIVQHPLISGEGQRNAYTNQIAISADGAWHISWNWRETGDVATNHDLCYAKSADGGRTWLKSTGEKYDLPITEANAEVVRRIPQKRELSNTTSTVVDSLGRPMFATTWREPDQDAPQFYLVWYDGTQWRTSQIGKRITAYRLSGGGTKRKPVSRPKLAVDRRDRIFMFFRDADRGERVSVAVCEDPNREKWRFLDLTEESVDSWEACYDSVLWRRDGIFHLFLQRVGQGDGERIVDVPPQMVSILEWRPD